MIILKYLYSPSSDNRAEGIWKTPSTNLCCQLRAFRFPLVHVKVGVGFPLASQRIWIWSPSYISTTDGVKNTSGASPSLSIWNIFLLNFLNKMKSKSDFQIKLKVKVKRKRQYILKNYVYLLRISQHQEILPQEKLWIFCLVIVKLLLFI